MSRRIVTVDPQVAAQEALAKGHADFQVQSAETLPDGVRRFIISVPFTVVREGFFGPVSNAIGGNGTPTRFGNRLFYALNALDDIEPAIIKELRTAIPVYVQARVTEEPPEGWHYQSHGLPASVCLAIQASIIRHRTPIGRAMEYLRRII